jgi:hypothetical protein
MAAVSVGSEIRGQKKSSDYTGAKTQRSLKIIFFAPLREISLHLLFSNREHDFSKMIAALQIPLCGAGF